MADKDLAELVRGESAPKTGKTCPFCSGDILPRAQKCKYCGGWVVALQTALTPEWQGEAASPGQLKMLKRLKQKASKGMTRGEAATRLTELKRANLGAFESLEGVGHASGRKKGFPAFGLFLIVVVGLVAAGAWLHLTGRSEPVLKKVNADKWLSLVRTEGDSTQDREPLTTELTTQDVTPDTVAPKGTTRKARVASGATSADVEGIPEDPEYVAISKTFRPPRPGQKVKVSVRGKSEVSGVLKLAAPDHVVILRPAGAGHAEITLLRKDLAAWSQALFYESDYVAYVMARREMKQASDERAEDVARRADQYRAAFAAMQQERRSANSASRARIEGQRRRRSSTRSAAAAVESGEMSIREWMELNGMSEEVKARQERVRQHEAANPGM